MKTLRQSSEDPVEVFYTEAMLDNHIPKLKFLFNAFILNETNTGNVIEYGIWDTIMV